MENLADAGFEGFKLSVVVTRENVPQLDAFKALADRYHAQLRLTRLRPSGRGADVWDELHPTAAQQRELYEWLLAHGEDVLTGDSFFHLGGYGGALPGLNLCGAGRVVCLIDPIGDVYACPFVIHDEFLAGNVREPGGFARVWRESELFTALREPQHAGACASCGLFDKCRGGCMAAKFFTGLPLAGPDPECVLGHGEAAAGRARRRSRSRSRRSTCRRERPGARRAKHCDESPLAVCARRETQTEPVVRVGGGGPAPGQARLPKSVYSALIAGSEAGMTCRQRRRVRRARLRPACRPARPRSAT